MKDYRIAYKSWAPEKQKLREALCTLGNGYFATRGAAEESSNDKYNYPGTYLGGGYNRAKTEVAGRVIDNEDFVNFPNWLCLSFRTEENGWLNFEDYKMSGFLQMLNIKEGVLERTFSVEDNNGRITSITSRRFVSMHDMHSAGIKWILKPENWSGKIELKSALDGKVKNEGVDRYSQLESQHLNPLSSEINKDIILLSVETRQSKIIMAQAARTCVYQGEEMLETERDNILKDDYVGHIIRFDVEEGKEYTIEKIISLYTSRDKAISEPSLEARIKIKEKNRFDKLLSDSIQTYRKLWHRFDIVALNESNTQCLLRLHIFHILQSVSPNSIDLDTGVTSRGLHGEAYRGHIFWDELYIYPFFNYRFPEITRSLLMYRYNRLPEARKAAAKENYKGAMYPWQSGSNGREESQVLHLNPKSGRWLPDDTYLQRHINSAIAYNIWKYFLVTGDQQFLSFYGAEMFLSIALFWGSKSIYNKERDKYELHNVVGPDEYHTSYPDSDEAGLRNNAYTNVMAAWVLQKALEILELIESTRKKELLKELRIDDEQLKLWSEISTKMYIPFLERGIIEQFEGYGSLKEFPWEEYWRKYKDIARLDRILESEGDTPDNYKASKQADVLMLFYLFTEEEIGEIFKKLGYEFNTDMIRKNIEYYRDRTSHGSTLSRFVFSWILAKYDQSISWENFETLLKSDFEDIQGGTTPEGIHLGAMAGSLDIIQRCYSGIEVRDEALWIKPVLPEHLKQIKFRINYRQHWILLTITHEKLTISFEEGWSNKVKIGLVDQIYEFSKGEKREFEL